MPKESKKPFSEYEDRIKALSERWGCERSEIEEVLKKNLETFGDEKIAWRKMVAELDSVYGSFRSNAFVIYAYVIGESGLTDAVETKLKPHSRAIGMVDASGQELDYREFLFGNSNRPNPQFNMPYSKPEWEREIWAIVSNTPDFARPSLAKLFARYEVAENISVKSWNFYKVRVTLPNRQDPKRMTYNLTRASRFVEIPSQIRPYELVEKLKPISVLNAIELSGKFAHLKDYEQSIAIVEGFVGYITKKPSESVKKITIKLMDEDGNSINVFFPKFFELPISDGSEIYVFGTFGRIKETPIMRGVGLVLGKEVLYDDEIQESDVEEVEEDQTDYEELELER